MRALLQRLGNQLATAAAHLAGVRGVHSHHVSTGACSLGDTEGLEVSPASISDGRVQTRLGRCPIRQIGAFLFRVRLRFRCFGHVRDLQVFQDHCSKAVHQRTRGLMVEVPPLVAHPPMGFSQRESGPFAPMGTALFAILGRFATA